MIIFGSRSAHLNTVNPFNTKCPSCNTANAINMSIFSKHGHLFWIPMFPIGKEVVAQCQHCKLVLTEKEMTAELKAESFKLRSENKPPIWQFSGLAVFAGIIVLASFTGKKDKENTQKWLASPVAGDVYDVSVDEGYTTLKITKVSKDSIWINPNQNSISRLSKIYKIKSEENYSPEIVGMNKAELKQMFTDGKIVNIDRIE